MTIIGLVLLLVVVGLLVYGIGYLPIDPTLKRIAQGVVIILFALWLGEEVGLFGPFTLGGRLHR